MHFSEYDTRLAAYVLLTDAGRILLTWFNGSDGNLPCWSMPGGGVEFDEAVRDAAVREAYEETGFHVSLGALLAEDHFTVGVRPGRRPFRSQRFLYAATIVGGELGTTEIDGSTDYAQWVPLDELAGLTRSSIVDVALRVLDPAGAYLRE